MEAPVDKEKDLLASFGAETANWFVESKTFNIKVLYLKSKNKPLF